MDTESSLGMGGEEPEASLRREPEATLRRTSNSKGTVKLCSKQIN